MNRVALNLAMQLGFWVAIFVPVFTAIFAAIFVSRSAHKEPYLKRVARKYSIPPLDLR